jgi:hypothetical protein
MGDIVDGADYITYSREMVGGIGVAGPPVEETEAVAEEVDVNSEEIENIEEDIGRNVDVTV